MADDAKIERCYLIENLLVPLFDISKGEKKTVLDGVFVVVSSCPPIVWVALQKRGETKLRDF
jgi:hypothetical protein